MNQEIRRVGIGEACLVSVRGDITEEVVDAIVNAANEHLRHGGGVAGAIVRRGGPTIQEESLRIAPVPTGSAKATGAGALPCRWVIHAVGPVWRGGRSGEPDLLASAVRSALQVASDLGCRTVSVPAISCGIYGYPVAQGAPILVGVAIAFLRDHPDSPLREVRFCNLDPETARDFDDEITRIGEDAGASAP